MVRYCKGFKDMVTMLPDTLADPLRAQMERARELHQRDLAVGLGEVYLPYALDRKYPHAGREWMWQYVFPAEKISEDSRSGKVRRHHVQDQAVQRAIKQAVRDAGLNKPATPHTLRHSLTEGNPRRMPLICSKVAMTSARCRSCWGIRT